MSSIELLKQNLVTLKVAQLRSLAKELGAPTSGNKALLTENILATCSFHLRLHQLILDKQKHHLTITSLDPGVSNLSYATIRVPISAAHPTLTKWTKIKLDISTTTTTTQLPEPAKTTSVTEQFCDSLLHDPATASTDLFVIERQRLRTHGSVWVPNPILRVNILEHLIFAKLQDRSRDGINTVKYYCVSSDPAKMVKYWVSTEPIGTEKSKNKSKSKSKSLRKSIVQRLLFGDDPEVKLASDLKPVHLSSSSSFSIYDMLQLSEQANGKRKDDDLCDSFLHALTWARWFKAYLHLSDELLGCGKL